MRAADSRPCKGNRSLIPYPSRATARAAPAVLRKPCLKSGGRVLNLSLLFVGAGPRPARGRTLCAPTAENGPGALVRKPRRRRGTAAASIFSKHRPPVGPDGTAPKHPCFCAPEMFCPLQGVTPVTGVRGKGEYGHAVSILSRPPAILWFLSHRWERNSPPAGGEIPPARNETALSSPPHPSRLRRATFPQGEGLDGAEGEVSAST